MTFPHSPTYLFFSPLSTKKTKLLSFLLIGSAAGLKQEELPVPQLIWEQVAATLERLGVEVRRCDGEADPDLAFSSRQGLDVLKVQYGCS